MQRAGRDRADAHDDASFNPALESSIEIAARPHNATPSPPEVEAEHAHPFACFIGHLDGCAVVTVRGEIDMATSPQFSTVVNEALTASPHLVLDMEGVTFLDSNGLRVIALAAVRATPDGSITIRNASRSVTKLLSVTGFESHVSIEPATGVDPRSP
jgi:anti-anti-sigma factor